VTSPPVIAIELLPHSTVQQRLQTRNLPFRNQSVTTTENALNFFLAPPLLYL
jgi:hypothetical protein